MRLIEALKKQKDLLRKADDLRAKIRDNCADLEIHTPAYGTEEKQRAQIAEWLQAHSDILREIANLRIAVQRTNLATMVAVEVEDGKVVEKSIAEWIHRRRDLALLERDSWNVLKPNSNLKPMNYRPEGAKDGEVKVANVRKYYDQAQRDKCVEKFTSEPVRIDAALEIANATTDVIE